MQLVLLHPEVAFRDCGHCQRFFYDEDGANKGRMRIGRDGQPEPRPPGAKPPCRRTGSSCPKGTPETQIMLSERNWKAWDIYRRCKLTGQWPDDPIVIEMGVLLDEVMDRVREVRQTRAIIAAAAIGQVASM